MAIPGVRPRFLAPGDKLGKFELIRQIAVGGMAELYLARTMGIEGFEKLVVVKRILPQYADNQQFVSMFLNEARLSATLHHANIAQVYDIGVEDGDYFFSMEYIHGEDLGRLHATGLENGVPMSLDAALTLVAGLCAGLHYAHTKAGPDGKPLEVVHRDVSPSNVIVSYDGGVKLVDFGIARAGSAPTTTRGGLKGKIAYMSPEQCKGDGKLDRRSDIFSIGTILYELTTGRLPFPDDNEYAVLNSIVNVDVPRPSTIVPSYAPALETIVLKALARDAAHRYATALELQKEIEDFAHENRLRVSPLVLARLMSTLFPARLEEWDQARAQGAFFVEQHVVRTLVESGKTQVEAHLAQIPMPLPQPIGPVTDDEATAIVTALPPPKRPSVREATREPEPFAPEDNTSTIPGVNPFEPDTRTLPGQGPISLRASSPAIGHTPPIPHPTPPAASVSAPATHSIAPQVVAAAIAPEVPPFTVPAAGTLVSNSMMDAAPIAASKAIDVTERVRVPRNDDTAFVRSGNRSRAPLVIGIAVVLAGAGIAMFIAFGGSDATTPASATPAPAHVERQPLIAPIEPRTEEVVTQEPATEEPAPPPPEPAVKAEPVAAPEETPTAPEPVAVERKVETKRPVVKTARKTPVKKAAIKKPVEKAPKKEPKLEPKKEAEWNVDSPFMPVRQ